MKTLSVKVQGDHLESLARTPAPLDAVTELIWNGLDADATDVRVRLIRNAMGGLDGVRVSDNGHGLRYEDVESAFENLGGSWKKATAKTRGKGRLMHGKLGKGRFKAFALGNSVEWRTRFKDNGALFEYAIAGNRSSLQTFQVGDSVKSTSNATGTEVEVTNLLKNFISLKGSAPIEMLTEEFALYLRQYPNIAIRYDGTLIDPAAVESNVEDYKLDSVLVAGDRWVTATLTVIEWRTPNKRALLLCDGHGFTLHELHPGIHAPGFSFTAYLKSDYLREMEEEGAFSLQELHPELRKLLAPAKEALKAHFRKRASDLSAAVVEEWKKQDVYPYKGEPQDVIEQVERQVFDVLALNVNEYLPDFDTSAPTNKRFAFSLLKHAIESSPSDLQRILKDVLDLPGEKQRELAELLQKTSLEAIINASKLVSDRLNFLAGLELLVFDEPAKSALLERRQLHRILADHTWLFGEEFNLTVDDRSLTKVLEAHLKILGREPDTAAPVLDVDGGEGLIDLMLSRSIPQAHADESEHLVVELKRPKVAIDAEVMSQVQRYAMAVANDERFRETKTRWIFWAVSNELHESVRRMARQRNRPEGLYYDDEELRIAIWVKTWGQIIQECKGRLRFFQDHLKYAADEDSALAYLRAAHEKYLPKALLEAAAAKQLRTNGSTKPADSPRARTPGAKGP